MFWNKNKNQQFYGSKKFKFNVFPLNELFSIGIVFGGDMICYVDEKIGHKFCAYANANPRLPISNASLESVTAYRTNGLTLPVIGTKCVLVYR